MEDKEYLERLVRLETSVLAVKDIVQEHAIYDKEAIKLVHSRVNSAVTDINEIKSEIMKAKGMGYMLIKIGAVATIIISSVVAFFNHG